MPRPRSPSFRLLHRSAGETRGPPSPPERMEVSTMTGSFVNLGRRFRGAALIAALLATVPTAAVAQSGGLGGALVTLFNSPDGATQIVRGTLYGASVRFEIDNVDGN